VVHRWSINPGCFQVKTALFDLLSVGGPSGLALLKILYLKSKAHKETQKVNKVEKG